jgi:hypothetical protein
MKDTPFQLTLAGFKASALKAIAEQRLAIQHEDGLIAMATEDGSQPACLNTYEPAYFGGKMVHCIVGCAVEMEPDHELFASGILDLRDKGYIAIDQDSLAVLKKLQKLHDQLVTDLFGVIRETDADTDQRKRRLKDWSAEKVKFFAAVEAELKEIEETA